LRRRIWGAKGFFQDKRKSLGDRLTSPVLTPTFSTRLKKRPALILVFTQGQPNRRYVQALYGKTKRVFWLYGFKPKEIIVAGGTREKADVDKQKDLMAKAKATGGGLGE